MIVDSIKKPQNLYTFEEAKETSIKVLSALEDFCFYLHKEFPDAGFNGWKPIITLIKELVKESNKDSKYLIDFHIEKLVRFGKAISWCNPRLIYQLHNFWKMYWDLMYILKQKGSDAIPLELNELVQKNMKEIHKMEDLSRDTILATKKESPELLKILSVFLLHLVRTQAIEHPIREQMKVILNYGLNKYDLEDICSVESKIKKGKEWVTDSRAIRDAIAHDKFSIKDSNGKIIIKFDNDEKGYNFHKKFTKNEFFDFFNQYSLLYKFQLFLLLTMELIIVLQTHLLAIRR